MHEVIHNNTGDGLDYGAFKTKFIEICNNHRSQDEVLAFAFILYDKRNPEVRRMLEDAYYYEALDEESGPHLSVFSFRFESPAPFQRVSTPPPGLHGFMTQETIRPSSNKYFLKKYFPELENSDQPALVFFQVKDNRISDLFIQVIEESPCQQVFEDVRDMIRAAVSALDKITPENKNNHDEIFRNLTRAVDSSVTNSRVKRLVGSAVDLGSFLLDFGQIFG